MRGKSFVYELWSDLDCLYVGATSKLPQRIAGHTNNTIYAGQVTHIIITVHATRAEAFAAEADRIFELQPLHNSQSKNRGISA